MSKAGFSSSVGGGGGSSIWALKAAKTANIVSVVIFCQPSVEPVQCMVDALHTLGTARSCSFARMIHALHTLGTARSCSFDHPVVIAAVEFDLAVGGQFLGDIGDF